MCALGNKYDITVLKYSALVSFEKLTTKSQSDLPGWVKSITTLFSSTLESEGILLDATLAKITANPSSFLHDDVKVSS